MRSSIRGNENWKDGGAICLGKGKNSASNPLPIKEITAERKKVGTKSEEKNYLSYQINWMSRIQREREALRTSVAHNSLILSRYSLNKEAGLFQSKDEDLR